MINNFKKIVLVLFSCLILLDLNCNAASIDQDDSIPVFSDSSAQSFLLMDADSGDVLCSRNPDLELPMASTTKIMTCIVALEKAFVSDEVIIPQEAVGIEGSSVYLVKGEKLKLEELLYALMLESANDAATAIAIHVSGSIEDFAWCMNEKAKEIGMEHTNFINPHGLPADGHYSTARDLSLLMRYGMKNEAFREFTGTRSISISAPNGKTRFLSNHNKLLRLYEDCIGGKTGFTKQAGRCLVTSAKRGDKELICATLGDPDDWRDHSTLFDYGFSLYSQKEVLAKETVSFTVPVVCGEKSEVEVSNLTSVSLSLRSEESTETRVELPRFVYASVAEGQTLGEVILIKNGEEIQRIPLVAKTSVSKKKESLSFWQKIWQKIRLWFD